MDNNMFNSLSDAQIEEGLIQYKNVPSIVTLLEGIRQVREANRDYAKEALEAQAQVELAKVDFAAKVSKLAKLPPPPEGVYNIYLAYGEVDDTTKPEEVEVVKPNGNKVTETRYPKIKGWKVDTNKGFPVDKSTTSKPEVEPKKEAKRVATRTDIPEVVVSGQGWREAIETINASPELLAKAKQDKLGKDGKRLYIVETTASGKVDLESAGFQCYTI